MNFQLNIRLNDWDGFVEKVNKLNRKCKKLGVEPISYTYDEVPILNKEDNLVYKVYVNCPEIPKISGWGFAAHIESIKTDDGYINFISGPRAEELKHLRMKKLSCEHCNINRFRKHYYVVSNGEETKIVGSTCLKDFLGHDPKHAIDVFKIHKEFEDMGSDPSFGGEMVRFFSLREIVATTFAVIREMGGYKKREYISDFEVCTWDEVFHQFFLKYVKRRNSEDIVLNLQDIDWEKADKVLNDWNKVVDSIDIESCSDIDYKKYMFVKMNDRIPFQPKWFGPVVGIAYGTYIKIEKEENKKNREDLPGGFFGEIKKRDIFDLEVNGVRYFDSDYGTRTLIFGYNKDTNQKWVWFASGEKSKWEDYKGDVVRVKATVLW